MDNVKTCSKCNNIKPLTEFYKCKTTKDGLLTACKLCHSQYYKQRYDKAKNNTMCQKYRDKNREKHLEYRRQYYAKKKLEKELAKQPKPATIVW